MMEIEHTAPTLNGSGASLYTLTAWVRVPQGTSTSQLTLDAVDAVRREVSFTDHVLVDQPSVSVTHAHGITEIVAVGMCASIHTEWGGTHEH